MRKNGHFNSWNIELKKYNLRTHVLNPLYPVSHRRIRVFILWSPARPRRSGGNRFLTGCRSDRLWNVSLFAHVSLIPHVNLFSDLVFLHECSFLSGKVLLSGFCLFWIFCCFLHDNKVKQGFADFPVTLVDFQKVYFSGVMWGVTKSDLIGSAVLTFICTNNTTKNRQV